jgi:Na+-translocating ferredoxin:NAD+ oxidoreductase RnfD subunit
MDSLTITSAKYIAYYGNLDSIETVIDGITMSVPLDSANRHYAEIMRQVEAGELTIQDADD